MRSTLLQTGFGSGQHLLAQPFKNTNGTTTILRTTNFATFFIRLPFQFNLNYKFRVDNFYAICQTQLIIFCYTSKNRFHSFSRRDTFFHNSEHLFYDRQLNMILFSQMVKLFYIVHSFNHLTNALYSFCFC